MKMKNEIFNAKMLRAIGVAAVLCASNGAFAASNGCDKDDADYISPTLALCSTHVYNIGETENTKDSAKKQEMRETIALKTTVMTQQMYQQYEYLDAMVKRFRTQLEKAVLKTKLAAAGADTGETSSGSSFRMNNSSVKLAGAQDCVSMSYQNAYSCLMSNIQLVMNTVRGGNNIGEAKKQLEEDLKAAATWGIVTEENGVYKNLDKCNNLKATSNSITPCANQLNAMVSKASYNMEQQSKGRTYPSY